MAVTVTVRFSEVGRQKITWEADVFVPLTQHGLMREIRKRKALMSQDIDFADDGGIYVGVVRRVGSWAVVDREQTQ